MFLCFYGNVLVTSFTVILRPLDYGTVTRGNPGLSDSLIVTPDVYIKETKNIQRDFVRNFHERPRRRWENDVIIVLRKQWLKLVSNGGFVAGTSGSTRPAR
jgi:hypothetical protein